MKVKNKKKNTSRWPHHYDARRISRLYRIVHEHEPCFCFPDRFLSAFNRKKKWKKIAQV